MIKAEQIPDEVVEAAAKKQAELDNVEWHTLNDVAIKLRCDHARSTLAAGLAAWPDAELDEAMWIDGSNFLILPLSPIRALKEKP